MDNKTQKTDKEWEQIKFKNNLGPQIGGLLHDSVALCIANDRTDKEDIAQCLDTLYEIAEDKKKELTATQPKKDEEVVL